MLASVGLEGSLVVASGACVGAEGSVWVDRVDRAIVRFFLVPMLILLLDFPPASHLGNFFATGGRAGTAFWYLHLADELLLCFWA